MLIFFGHAIHVKYGPRIDNDVSAQITHMDPSLRTPFVTPIKKQVDVLWGIWAGSRPRCPTVNQPQTQMGLRWDIWAEITIANRSGHMGPTQPKQNPYGPTSFASWVVMIYHNYMGIGQIRRHIGDANLAGNN